MSEDLWGVIYVSKPLATTKTLVTACHALAQVSGHQALITENLANLLKIQTNIILPRQLPAGSLSAWVSFWEDFPGAQGAIFLDENCLDTSSDILTRLAQAHGKCKLLVQSGPFPGYYSRACLGAALRIRKQGNDDMQALLKALKAPLLR